MDIGVTQWTLDSSGVDAVYRAGQLGFSSIQLDYGGYDGLSELSEPDVKKAYQDASKEAGVEIVGVGCNVFNTVSLIDPQADITGLIENIMGGVRGVASLLYVPSFNASEIKTEDDMRNTAHWLKLVCDMADAHNITVATENTLDGQQQLKLIETVNHTNLKVFIDSLNPVLWGHNTAAIIRDVHPYLCEQFHAKDGINGKMGNARLGQGDANFWEILETLHSLDIHPLWILENEYGEDTETRVQFDIEVIRTGI